MPPALRSRKGPAPLQSGMFFHVTLVTHALWFLQPKEHGLLAILSLQRNRYHGDGDSVLAFILRPGLVARPLRGLDHPGLQFGTPAFTVAIPPPWLQRPSTALATPPSLITCGHRADELTRRGTPDP